MPIALAATFNELLARLEASLTLQRQFMADAVSRAAHARDDGARGRIDGGAGLGLALVRWIGRAHGGDVTLTHSSSSGSTFTVSLPRPS